jgi:AraC-like DNA-binding protein
MDMQEDQPARDLLGDLRALIVRHARGQLSRTVLPGLTAGVAAALTEPVSGLATPSLTVVAQGVKRTVLNDRIYDYLVVSVDLPVTGHVRHATAAEPFAAIAMTLDRALIAELLLEAPGHMPSRAVPGMVVSDAPAGLLDPVLRLLRLAESPADAAVLGSAVRREITWRLITGEQGAIVGQIGMASGPLAQVAHVTRRIREHYDEPLRGDRLAALAGMSVSTLHRHFRAATSMTPLQYQKQIRLQEARALLLSSARDVAQVGHLVGYESPSQFSREYRRLFGAPPRRDRDHAVKGSATNQS